MDGSFKKHCGEKKAYPKQLRVNFLSELRTTANSFDNSFCSLEGMAWRSAASPREEAALHRLCRSSISSLNIIYSIRTTEFMSLASTSQPTRPSPVNVGCHPPVFTSSPRFHWSLPTRADLNIDRALFFARKSCFHADNLTSRTWVTPVDRLRARLSTR